MYNSKSNVPLNIEEYKEDFLKYLPSFYQVSKDMRGIQTGLSIGYAELQANINDLLNQTFIETATWGIVYWERFLGIEIDESKPLDIRRSQVKSKVRGSGTTTKDLIKKVASSFINGEVDVIEKAKENRFDIKFISTLGVPSDLEVLTKSITEICPAHLAFGYIFSYLLLRDIHNKMTIEQLESTPLSLFAIN